MPIYKNLQGTTNPDFQLGKPDGSNKSLVANVEGVSKPALAWNVDHSRWESTNDGVAFLPIMQNPMTAQGDIVFGKASPVGAPDRLQGVNGAYLRSGGTAADPTFVRVLDVDGLIADVSVGASLDASAILQLNSTSKGMLLPRMTTTQMHAIVSPATGLIIYNTTTRKSHFYDGVAWRSVQSSVARVFVVSADGSGDYTTIAAALASILDAADDNRYVIDVSPGVYAENIDLKDYVSVNGTGWDCVLRGTVTADNPFEMTMVAMHVEATNSPAVVQTNTTYPGELDFLGCFLVATWDDTVDPSVVRSVVDCDGGVCYLYRETEANLYVNDTVNTATTTVQTIYHLHGTERIELESFNTYNTIDTDNPHQKITIAYNTNTNASTVMRLIGYESLVNLNGLLHANVLYAVLNDGGNGDLSYSRQDFSIFGTSVTSAKLITACSAGSPAACTVRMRNASIIKDGLSDSNVYLGSATSAPDIVSIANSTYRMAADAIPVRYTVDGAGGQLRFSVINTFGTSQASGLYNGAEVNADVTDWDNVSTALGGQAGAHAGYVFKSDGAGGGSMVKNTLVINHRITVGKSGDVDYNTIHEALAYAVANGGGTDGQAWQIDVFPGTYTEPPMTIPVDVNIISSEASRITLAYVVASNAAADLFTMTGGTLAGINLSGVTDPAKYLIRCDTAYSLAVLHSIEIGHCSNGLHVGAGATVAATNFTAQVTAPGVEIGQLAVVDGAGAYLGINSGFLSVPVAILPYYSVNPIQTCFRATNGAEVYIAGMTARVAPKTSTADVVLADNGASVTVLSSEIANSGNAFHIGSAGSSTNVSAVGVSVANNLLNIFVESSTGSVFATVSTDIQRKSVVTGGTLSGLIQYRTEDISRLVGDVRYRFASDLDVQFSDFFADFTSTGVCGEGTITAGSGLHVAVAAGDGWCNRSPAYDDVQWVEWVAVPSLLLTASSTNYVYYDQATAAIVASTGAPGSSAILLATVVTDGSSIRYLHETRRVIDNIAGRLDQYLLDTAKTRMKSGVATTQGTTVRKLNVGSGSYYLALNAVAYAGSGGDATWSYFYGANGATEVASQTLLDITNYDAAGTLTAMTAGYFRNDTVVITSDGRVSVIYGTTQYATQPLAEAGASANIPTFLQPSSFTSAKVVVQQGVGIAMIMDIRPTSGGGGSAGSGVTVHSALAGLNADDHTQYLLVAGTRAMSGALNMGTYAITNVGTVDGVTVSAHASRHAPGGADAISTDTPSAVLVGATAAPGSASSLVRSDHQHGVAAGVTPGSVGTANAEGSSSSVARADHVHAHGSQTVDTQHALAVAGTSHGFFDKADKTKLNGIAAGATNTPISLTAPVNVTKSTASAGTATQAAAQDHKHDISTAAAGTITFQSAAEGSATSLARSDHVHALAAPGAPADVTKATAATGSSSSVARADHKHDVSTAAASANPPGTASAEGSATSLARSDHAHGLAAFGSAAGTFCQGNDSRLSDDRTASGLRTASTIVVISSATAPTVGQTLVATASNAASWQSISASYPYSNEVTGAGSITTNNGSDTQMSGMTLTPPAGTYMVWFTGDITDNSNGSVATPNIYVGGLTVTSSERPFTRGSTGVTASFDCVARVTVNGSQAIQGMWRASGGSTATNTRRSLAIVRVS